MTVALTRWRVALWGLLLAVMYAAWQAPPAQDEVVAPVARAAPTAPLPAAAPSAGGPPLPVDGTPADGSEETWRQPFVIPAWARPAEPPPMQAAAAMPVKEVVLEQATSNAAPPLPFKALGRYEDERGPVALLLHFDQSLFARPGDKVADAYVLEAIKDHMAVFLHVPTQTRQSLELSSSP
ncbi:MAG TPA: hypothetical protein VK195_18800 [Burkholderiaceae bacterium]|nr:hypothetical protein [Burkholderiaceae bacterium]